jgi:hypothetical protein
VLLTRDAILQAQDLQHEDVAVPEWGGTVRVQMMTGTQRDALGAALIGPDKKPRMDTYRVRLLAACIVGEDGRPLFGPDEIEMLGGKSSIALDRVYAVAERLNGGGEQAVEAAEGN